MNIFSYFPFYFYPSKSLLSFNINYTKVSFGLQSNNKLSTLNGIIINKNRTKMILMEDVRCMMDDVPFTIMH